MQTFQIKATEYFLHFSVVLVILINCTFKIKVWITDQVYKTFSGVRDLSLTGGLMRFLFKINSVTLSTEASSESFRTFACK